MNAKYRIKLNTGAFFEWYPTGQPNTPKVFVATNDDELQRGLKQLTKNDIDTAIVEIFTDNEVKPAENINILGSSSPRVSSERVVSRAVIAVKEELMTLRIQNGRLGASVDLLNELISSGKIEMTTVIISAIEEISKRNSEVHKAAETVRSAMTIFDTALRYKI
jgi:hypothetical protein